jgi:CsoR family transcriptional regulator, copper-sensing transcriptional repressor
MTTKLFSGRSRIRTAPHLGRGGISDRDVGPWSKPALIRRFRRIEGQARGLQKMVEDDRDTDELLMQIASVREALHSAAAIILETYLATSAETILLSDRSENTEQLMEKTVDVFRRWAT